MGEQEKGAGPDVAALVKLAGEAKGRAETPKGPCRTCCSVCSPSSCADCGSCVCYGLAGNAELVGTIKDIREDLAAAREDVPAIANGVLDLAAENERLRALTETAPAEDVDRVLWERKGEIDVCRACGFVREGTAEAILRHHERCVAALVFVRMLGVVRREQARAEKAEGLVDLYAERDRLEARVSNLRAHGCDGAADEIEEKLGDVSSRLAAALGEKPGGGA